VHAFRPGTETSQARLAAGLDDCQGLAEKKMDYEKTHRFVSSDLISMEGLKSLQSGPVFV